MPRQNQSWHEQDLKEELAEYNESQGLIHKWSELSDVVYTCTRGRWSGHDIAFPLAKWQFALGVIYMIPKYSSRWVFFRRVGAKMHSEIPIREVRNPQKVDKLQAIAEKYSLDTVEFQARCRIQSRYWPLLP